MKANVYQKHCNTMSQSTLQAASNADQEHANVSGGIDPSSFTFYCTL
jgi:hypothetical protein